VFLLRRAVEIGFARASIVAASDRQVWEVVVPRVSRASISRPVDWRKVAMGLTLVTRGVASGASAGAHADRPRGTLPQPRFEDVLDTAIVERL